MPSDVRIWDGAAWVSLRGPAGPSAVSTNAGQLAKLGTDNLILVSSTDLDARYVNVSGDTMTGNLVISPAAAQLVVGGTGNTVQTIRSTDGGNATCNFTSGANSGQLVQTGTSFNFVNYASGGATSFSQAGNGLIRFFANSVQTLAVSGTGISVAGNITSTGTAHNFQPNSILVNAISGLTADSLSDVTVTTPVAGQVLRWNGTAFVNAALGYADITGAPAAASPSTTAGLASTAAGTVGTSALYARADHTHPTPALKADDLTDVTVTTPAAGQVLRHNGTIFVNATLNFSDLSGTQTNPTINAPSIFRFSILPAGQTDSSKFFVIPATAPVASTSITGVNGRYWTYGVSQAQENASIQPLTLGKVNTLTGLFTGGVATYSGWVSMVLGPDERHACVFPVVSGNLIENLSCDIRFYTATENSNWSTVARGELFQPQANAIQSRFVAVSSSFTFTNSQLDGTIANVSTGAATVTVTIPDDTAAAIPTGTRVEILDLSSTASTDVAPAALVTLSWNLNMSGGSNAMAGSGRLTLPGAVSRIEIIKTGPNRWYAFN